MLKSVKVGVVAGFMAPVLGVMTAGTAMAQPEVCTAGTARSAASNGDYATLCGCTQVTPSFIRHLQNRSDFASILTNTAQQCPGLNALLSDLPTASVSGVSSFEGRESDTTGFQPTSETGSNGQGSNPENGGGGGGSGIGGDTDDPDNGGGKPGNGDGKPGKGGGKPGHGGDKPGKGDGKPGHGDGKPGKGGGKPGHGGDKPDKGQGHGYGKGKGGGKGNNGGGNGPEGSSPGRGNNANNDEI